jgi:hypothetical protein
MTRRVWIVRWHGFEEERAGRQVAIDRWVQLGARGIVAEVLEVTAEGGERSASLVDDLRAAAGAAQAS